VLIKVGTEGRRTRGTQRRTYVVGMEEIKILPLVES
jgi:hypothetical protein